MLIEFQVLEIPEIQKQQLFDLKMAGVTPIIAHPERYKPVQDDISISNNEWFLDTFREMSLISNWYRNSTTITIRLSKKQNLK